MAENNGMSFTISLNQWYEICYNLSYGTFVLVLSKTAPEAVKLATSDADNDIVFVKISFSVYSHTDKTARNN